VRPHRPSLGYLRLSFANTLPPSTSTLYTVLNAARAPKRNAPRKAYIAAVDFKSEHPKDETLKEEIKKLAAPGTDGTWSVGTKREISGKPVTVFDVRWVPLYCTTRMADLTTQHRWSHARLRFFRPLNWHFGLQDAFGRLKDVDRN
jgi:hypothetical protein